LCSVHSRSSLYSVSSSAGRSWPVHSNCPLLLSFVMLLCC
jgi:hypothetical protein